MYNRAQISHTQLIYLELVEIDPACTPHLKPLSKAPCFYCLFPVFGPVITIWVNAL